MIEWPLLHLNTRILVTSRNGSRALHYCGVTWASWHLQSTSAHLPPFTDGIIQVVHNRSNFSHRLNTIHHWRFLLATAKISCYGIPHDESKINTAHTLMSGALFWISNENVKLCCVLVCGSSTKNDVWTIAQISSWHNCALLGRWLLRHPGLCTRPRITYIAGNHWNNRIIR